MLTRRATLLALGLAVLAAIPKLAPAQVVLHNMDLKAHFDDYPPAFSGDFAYSACWAYVHGDGREYAVIGTRNGTAFYNVTDPAATTFVGFIPGPNSIWREMKSYREWVYIVTEGTGTGEGVQIVRMADPEHPVLAATYTGAFTHAHTVSVDTARAILICNGTRDGSGLNVGMRVLSIASPEAPSPVSWYPGVGTSVPSANYIHDCVPVGNRLYASSIYSSLQRVFDFTDPAAITEIKAWTYPSAFYTHSAWPDETGHWLYVCDEQNGQTLRVFDISNLAAPILVNALTSNPAAIVHNPRVKGNELYLANYTEGVRVLDISDPAHPAEFAYADSWPGASGGFSGVWESCPYFPSGTVIASDIQSGLYVYRPVRDYGIVRVKVVDLVSGAPLTGVPVVLTSPGDSLTTPADGIVQFAPSPGSHTVQAVRPGYPYGNATVLVSDGSADTVTLAIPTGTFAGSVSDAVTLTPLDDAEVGLSFYAAAVHTGPSGTYAYLRVPDDLYQVEVRAPGYVPLVINRRIGPDFGGQSFLLPPAASWDALETNLGWTVGAPGDDATSGLWVRGDPIGTGPPQPAPARVGPPQPGPASVEARASAPARVGQPRAGPAGVEARATAAADLGRNPGLFRSLHGGEGEGDYAPGDVQPEFDRTPPPGTQCFVTGQGTVPGNVSENDVDNGHTSLTSPAMDLSGMTDPVIGFWRWFYTRDADGSDWFKVQISANNGSSWTDVETIYATRSRWTERAVRVLDYVTPTSQVKVRFVAADADPPGIVEAAVDDIITYEAGTVPVGVGSPAAPARLALRPPRPNPSAGDVALALELPSAGDVTVEVLDLLGRRVRTLHRGPAAAGTLALRWDGADEHGAPAPAGLYFARASAAGAKAEARLVRVK